MANPFTKGWKYLLAMFDSKIEQHADPEVQIQQSVDEAKRQHQALLQQASEIMGTAKQLEAQIVRKAADVEKLATNTRQAMLLADRARVDGNESKAREFGQQAESLATNLVTAESELEGLKAMQEQASQAADQAKHQVHRNSVLLQEKISESNQLRSHVNQAKMREQINASTRSMGELTVPGNTPTLDEVRAKIERRYTNAQAASELASGSVHGRMHEIEQASLESAASEKLRQIRASMNGEELNPGSNNPMLSRLNAPIDAEIVEDVPQSH